MTRIKIFTIATVSCILLATLWIIGSTRSPHQSDVIAKAVPEFGPNAHTLLANLNRARVIAPDRPHDPGEVFSEDKGARTRRG